MVLVWNKNLKEIEIEIIYWSYSTNKQDERRERNKMQESKSGNILCNKNKTSWCNFEKIRWHNDDYDAHDAKMMPYAKQTWKKKKGLRTWDVTTRPPSKESRPEIPRECGIERDTRIWGDLRVPKLLLCQSDGTIGLWGTWWTCS